MFHIHRVFVNKLWDRVEFGLYVDGNQKALFFKNMFELFAIIYKRLYLSQFGDHPLHPYNVVEPCVQCYTLLSHTRYANAMFSNQKSPHQCSLVFNLTVLCAHVVPVCVCRILYSKVLYNNNDYYYNKNYNFVEFFSRCWKVL